LNLSIDIQSDATGRIRYEYRHCGKKMKQSSRIVAIRTEQTACPWSVTGKDA